MHSHLWWQQLEDKNDINCLTEQNEKISLNSCQKNVFHISFCCFFFIKKCKNYAVNTGRCRSSENGEQLIMLQQLALIHLV